jgi:putative Holliday junction resolvase
MICFSSVIGLIQNPNVKVNLKSEIRNPKSEIFIPLHQNYRMGRIVAIDYGQKRTGLAVTDELKIFATGLTTVRSADVLEFLKDYTGKNKVECFVVGEPKQMNYTDSESAVFIEPFVKALVKAFPQIPVKRADERFTSLLASRAIREAGLKKKDRQDKALVDTVSATIMLQSYMQTIK